jgi:hypothetical protein
MTERASIAEEPTQHPTETPSSAKAPKRPRPAWILPAAALAAGLLVGGAVGAGVTAAVSDPTASAEYQELESQLATARDSAGIAVNRAETAEAAAASARADAAEREAALKQREADVAAREAAVNATEQQIVANSITEGIWTVGVDIEPGTYRTAEALTGYCYWAIYRSGTNGDDIIENDGPEGGYPTVTLSVGQDFENSGCGTFVKQ